MPLVRRPLLVLTFALVTPALACGGSAPKPAPVARKGPTTPPELGRVRAAHAAFEASRGEAADFLALVEAVEVERPRLGPPGVAEAELVIASAGARVLAARLDDEAALDDPDGAVTGALLPVLFTERALDGESAMQYRDRLCDAAAREVCEGVLPEFWPRALAYEAAARLAARAEAAAAACPACARRYADGLARVRDLAGRAALRRDEERASWALEGDRLPRSAFVDPAAEEVKAHARATVGVDGALGLDGAEIAGGKPKQVLDALVAALTAARGETPAGEGVLEVRAAAEAPASAIALFGQAAARAGYRRLVLVVRQAAPPHYPGRFVLELVTGKAPSGSRAPKLQARDTAQAYVDRLDAEHAALGGQRAPLVLVVAR